MELTTGETARFKVDDSADPGWARVRILGTVPGVMDLPTYRIEVLTIIHPSKCRRLKPGVRLTAAAVDLLGGTRLEPERQAVIEENGD